MRLKLYELRINNNLSQQELADLAGISRVHYTQIENNTGNKKPSLDVAIAIKKALNYNGDDLFEDDEASTMIGDKIAEQRKKLGLNQEELAKALDISQKSISKYERGDRRPSYEVLLAMASLFNVSVDYLLGMAEPEASTTNRLKSLRKAKGMKQSELGELLNVQDAAISKYESGKIPLTGDTLLKLSEIFNVSVDYLLGLSKPESSVTREFGFRLRELRASEGITQLQMAEILDISKSNISKYEAGTVEPGIDTIVKIAKFFNVTTDYLFGMKKGGDTMETEEKISEIAQDINNTGGENMRLAENMRFLRTQKGLNQRQFADELGVSGAAVAMWETGKREPELSMLIVIAEFYGVTLDELVLKEMKPPMPLYASNLAYLRKKHNMTQQDVAELIGLKDKSSISLIEDGKTEPSISQFSKLADFFGVTIDQLVKEDLTQEVSE